MWRCQHYWVEDFAIGGKLYTVLQENVKEGGRLKEQDVNGE
jgi:hypothetical protein